MLAAYLPYTATKTPIAYNYYNQDNPQLLQLLNKPGGASLSTSAAPTLLMDAHVAAALSDSVCCLAMNDHTVKTLLRQATEQHQLQQHHAALKALDLALQLQPACLEALWQRAAVHAAAGHHTACFMDLRTLSQRQPSYPGLAEALQQAAQAVSQQQAARTTAQPPPRKTYVRTTRRGAGSSHGPAGQGQGLSAQQAAYGVLGLQPGADVQAVRQAYKQLATQLHPDKWVLAGADQQAVAEERFKQVASAYQRIMEAEERAQH